MLDAQQSCPGAPFTFAQDAKAASIKTAQLEVIVNIERGNLTFRTLGGESLLNEGNSIPRTYEPVELNGDHTYRVTDRFSPSIAEALYGLGQHQSGMFNYRGATVELGQNNTDVAIPLLISSKGYGLMWNTAALTYFDNRFPLDMKLTSIAAKSIDYYFIYGPEIDAVLHEYRTMTGPRLCCPSGPTASFNRRIATYHSTKSERSQSAIARSTSRLTPWFRTGSGGRPKVIQSSIPTITT
jgi:alpha-D-xyloside xylohydrolase